MRIFVTGATGFVGSAVVQDLISAGHQVLGLARSDAGAALLSAAGAEVHRGTLEDLDSLRKGAAAVDGVIHTGFNHDFSRMAANCELDRLAIEALGDALAGSNRPLLVTSGLALLAPGRVGTEADAAVPRTSAYPRASEATALALAAKGLRASVVRLPPSVHGQGDHGFVPTLIAIAREKGQSVYIGKGVNRWPAVHRLDAARAYRLAIEGDVTRGPFHAVAEEGVAFKNIAEVIADRLGVPLVSKSPQDAAEHFGWFAMFAALDAPASSVRSRDVLNWEPTHPGLLEDIGEPGYYRT